jgi:hypothetical protein
MQYNQSNIQTVPTRTAMQYKQSNIQTVPTRTAMKYNQSNIQTVPTRTAMQYNQSNIQTVPTRTAMQYKQSNIQKVPTRTAMQYNQSNIHIALLQIRCHSLHEILTFAVRDSSVGIVTGYRLGGPGSNVGGVARFSAPIQTDPGTNQRLIHRVPNDSRG